MAKILTEHEILKIITTAIKSPGCIDCSDQYAKFLTDLAVVVADHFGGEAGEAYYDEHDNLNWTVAFRVDESVPPDGGVYQYFDTDVTWKDGVET